MNFLSSLSPFLHFSPNIYANSILTEFQEMTEDNQLLPKEKKKASSHLYLFIISLYFCFEVFLWMDYF